MPASGSNVTIEVIQAEPVKRFFIEILTRDIELVPAILELVDNSIDSARTLRPDKDYAGLRIDIEASASSFAITDNCAGISLAAAKNYVFRIGRPSGTDSTAGSIGQFGVGMKRALFKMGSAFSVESITENSHFELELVVPDWEATPGWDLELQVHEEPEQGYPDSGTTIIISTLLPSISAALGDPVQLNRLWTEIQSKHRLALESGLSISLNGRDISTTPTLLAVHEDENFPLTPYIERFDVEDASGHSVSVSIYAGVVSTTETSEDDDPDDVALAEDEAGWYVFGNERLLIGADKSSITGWGGAGNLPLFHNQFSRFRGYVYMNASDSTALPWITTKMGVETSDPVWLRVKGEMTKAGKRVIAMLNSLKKERSAEAQGLELPLTISLEKSRLVPVRSLESRPSQDFTYPKPNPALNSKSQLRRIAYEVPKDEFNAVSEALNETMASRIGRATFEHFLNEVVDY
jgi:hypothetical protein